MNPRTELVMGRYRELKATGLTGLEASRVVLKEAQEWTLGVEPTEITTTESRRPPVTVTQETCNACNKPYNNRGDVCNACRQKAYRERSK